jgi:hypothetical protein
MTGLRDKVRQEWEKSADDHSEARWAVLKREIDAVVTKVGGGRRADAPTHQTSFPA